MAITESADRIKEILEAKCEAADLNDICQAQKHLTADEQGKLHTLLSRYEKLFDGTLGTWNLEPVDLELTPDAKPYHARPYPVPRCHEATLRMEVARLVELGVLKKVNRSEWGAPSFIIPKKVIITQRITRDYSATLIFAKSGRRRGRFSHSPFCAH